MIQMDWKPGASTSIIYPSRTLDNILPRLDAGGRNVVCWVMVLKSCAVATCVS